MNLIWQKYERIVVTIFLIVFTASLFLLSGCELILSTEEKEQRIAADAENKLNPGKSLFDMMNELTFDGIEFKLPCKVSDMPVGFTLLDESFAKSGERYELLFEGKVAGFVIIENLDENENALIDILSVNLIPPENEKYNYCDFAVSGISFAGETKSNIETIFSEYVFSGDNSLLVYSFIDGSVIFNFDENNTCNFIVIGGGMENISE